jgi:hypothetical protein
MVCLLTQSRSRDITEMTYALQETRQHQHPARPTRGARNPHACVWCLILLQSANGAA